ncbi:hypothetical protein [Paracoccus sp. SSK6]|uniref:hypothetical protein n=1 Tax=Paracoccus sp. SSK6 TaxID=3143131 RepID=UPI003218FDE4
MIGSIGIPATGIGAAPSFHKPAPASLYIGLKEQGGTVPHSGAAPASSPAAARVVQPAPVPEERL